MTKKIPKFKSEDEERKFWATQDSTEYVGWKKAKRVVLPELKPSLKTTAKYFRCSRGEFFAPMRSSQSVRSKNTICFC